VLGQLALLAGCRVSPDIFVSPEASLVIADPLSTESLRRAVADLGFELFELQVSGPDSRRTMQLRIDLPGGGGPGRGVTTADCAVVSRALERQLEAAGAVGPRWRLEVSSPGIERPVRFPEHWRRYIGREVRVKAMGVPGRVTGRIVALPDESQVTLALADGEVTFALDRIREATLVVDWSRYGKREVGEG
jgi:ribosome maturation factor RimP